MIMYSEYANAGHSQNGIIVSQWTPGKFIVDAKETVTLMLALRAPKIKQRYSIIRLPPECCLKVWH